MKFDSDSNQLYGAEQAASQLVYTACATVGHDQLQPVDVIEPKIMAPTLAVERPDSSYVS